MHQILFVLFFIFSSIETFADQQKPYTSKKLPTGLELIQQEVHKVPLVTIVLAVKAGAMTETRETNGLTHLWEHMFFKGNKRLPNQEAFYKRIRQLGIVYNGDTSAELVRYYFTLPSAYLEDGLQFMADAISTPLLDQTELEKERQVVLNEYERSAAMPGFDFHNLEEAILFGDQAYLRDPLGKRQEIANATREQLLKIKDEVFVPSNSALLVSGDFDPKNLEDLVQKHFSDWKDPQGWTEKKHAPFPTLTQTTQFVMLRPNLRNATTKITFTGPRARIEPEDSYAADILLSLLAHKSGKFYQKFHESGLTLAAGLSYHTQSQAGEITLYATTTPEKSQEAEKKLLAEISEWLKPDYFSNEELEDVRRNLLIDRKRELNQPSEYIKTLGFWWGVTGLNYYDSYFENLRRIGFKEVHDFINKWMIGKNYVAATLMSPDDAKRLGIRETSKELELNLLKDYHREDLPKKSL